LSFSHSSPTPSLEGPPPISIFEGAHDFRMRDFVNVFNEVGTQQLTLVIGMWINEADISTENTDRVRYQSEHGWIRSQSTQP
jgi:hypothetical protein